MDSLAHKGAAEVKEENAEDGDTAAVFPEYISIHEPDIKQECAGDTSADSRCNDGDTTVPNIEAPSCYETFNQEMISQKQSHHSESKISADFTMKVENIVEEDTSTTPVSPGFAIEIQEADMKGECARNIDTAPVDICGTLAISKNIYPLSRMEFFKEWLKHSKNNRNIHLFDFISNRFCLNDATNESIRGIKLKISSFSSKIADKWKAAGKMLKRFMNKNKSWLDAGDMKFCVFTNTPQPHT